tara:strand:+ start:18 stop:461 length:444 start_codon:yes stop_codon:yes gene_type:complete
MVMRALSIAVTESFWTRLLEALYTGLEDRDATGYAWAPSDGWTQSRTPEEWRAHLECWLDLGGVITLSEDAYLHECRLVFALRYHADDDSVSQARMQAAIRDACEYLLRVPLPDSARVLGISQAAIEGVYEGGWVQVTIGFTLYVPR